VYPRSRQKEAHKLTADEGDSHFEYVFQSAGRDWSRSAVPKCRPADGIYNSRRSPRGTLDNSRAVEISTRQRRGSGTVFDVGNPSFDDGFRTAARVHSLTEAIGRGRLCRSAARQAAPTIVVPDRQAGLSATAEPRLERPRLTNNDHPFHRRNECRSRHQQQMTIHRAILRVDYWA